MTIPIIIDIEASGFGKDSYPIEIGYVDESGKTWCSLIKPQPDWQHWDAEAASLHKISRQTLIDHGKDALTIAEHLNQVFLGKVIYTDGWLHDYTWLARLYDIAGISPHFKLEDLRNKLTSKQKECWHQVKQLILSQQTNPRHRASVDAKVLQLTWLKTLN
jgi:hypothetical protein